MIRTFPYLIIAIYVQIKMHIYQYCADIRDAISVYASVMILRNWN